MTEARCVWAAGAELGEGPLWAAAEQALYWVDIKRPRLLRYDPAADDARTAIPMPAEIGCVGLRARGGLVAALRSGFAFVDPRSGAVETIADPEADRPDNRFNDGKCDARGRFWAGTMDDACRQPTGSLYRLDPDLRVTRVDTGYVVTNGPAFSPDGRVMYHTDSVAGRVYAFDCDPDAGEVADKRVFLEVGDGDGSPDGMTVDADGFVWIAFWDGWCVRRYAPDGRADREVRVPVARVTSCAFGGPDLATLYLTTASIDLTAEQRAAQPLAGGLFAADVGVRGLPAPVFAG